MYLNHNLLKFGSKFFNKFNQIVTDEDLLKFYKTVKSLLKDSNANINEDSNSDTIEEPILDGKVFRDLVDLKMYEFCDDELIELGHKLIESSIKYDEIDNDPNNQDDNQKLIENFAKVTQVLKNKEALKQQHFQGVLQEFNNYNFVDNYTKEYSNLYVGAYIKAAFTSENSELPITETSGNSDTACFSETFKDISTIDIPQAEWVL